MFATAHPCDEQFKKSIDVLNWNTERTNEFTQPFFVSVHGHPPFVTILMQIINRYNIETSSYQHDEFKHLIAICNPSVRSVESGAIMLLPTSQAAWKHCFWLSRDNMIRVLVTALTTVAEDRNIPWGGIPECARRLLVVLNRAFAAARWPAAQYDKTDALGGTDIYFEELYMARHALQGNVLHVDPFQAESTPENTSAFLVCMAWLYFRRACGVFLDAQHRGLTGFEKPEHLHGLWEQFFYHLLQEPHGTPLVVSNQDKHTIKDLEDTYRELTDQFPFQAAVFRLYVQFKRNHDLDIDALVRSGAVEGLGHVAMAIEDLLFLDSIASRLHCAVAILERVKHTEEDAIDTNFFLPCYWQLVKASEAIEASRAMAMILGKRLWRAYDGMAQFHKNERAGEWRLFPNTTARSYYQTMRLLWPSDVNHAHVATSFTDPRARHENVVALNMNALDWQLTSLLGFLKAAHDSTLAKNTLATNEAYARIPEFSWFSGHVLFGMHHSKYGWHIFRRFLQTLTNITLEDQHETLICIRQICGLLSRCETQDEVLRMAKFWQANLVRERYHVSMTEGAWTCLRSIVNSKQAVFERNFPSLHQAAATEPEVTQGMVTLSHQVRHDIFRLCFLPAFPRNHVIGIVSSLVATPISDASTYVLSISPRVGNADLRTCAGSRTSEYLPSYFKSGLESIPLQWSTEVAPVAPSAEMLYVFLGGWEIEARQTDCVPPSYRDITERYYLPPLAFVDYQWCYLRQCTPMQISTQSCLIFSDRLRHLTESFTMTVEDVTRGAAPLAIGQAQEDVHLPDAAPAEDQGDWNAVWNRLQKSRRFATGSIEDIYTPQSLNSQ